MLDHFENTENTAYLVESVKKSGQCLDDKKHSF